MISIGQSPIIRFVHFPIKSKVMNWKKDFSSVFFIFILVVETDIEKKSLLYVFGVLVLAVQLEAVNRGPNTLL